MASSGEEAFSSILIDDKNIPAVNTPTVAGPSTTPLSPVPPLPHHVQQPLCYSRPRYRQGRRLTAVKAYTISDESIHLIINGVPGLNLQRELKSLCLKYGAVHCLERLPDYPVEPFAEAYLVKYSSVTESRFAKKMLDGKNFFGGVFHVCYAPELESVDETMEKLQERQRAVQTAIRKQEREKMRLEAGSVLCEYHPDDRLASAVKRVTNRLSYNKGPVTIGPINLNNENTDHQRKSSPNNDQSNCVSKNPPQNSYGLSHTMTDNPCPANVRQNTMETVPCLQTNGAYTVPPPPFQHFPAANVTNSQSSQVPYISQTSSHETNSNQSGYPYIASHNSNERSETGVEYTASSSVESSSNATAAIGQQYASMSTDYEPGLGCTAGECYVASTKKRKGYSVNNKTTVKSFTIKPTKAYKRRRMENTSEEKRSINGTSKSKLSYREVVRSLQNSSDGNEQLERLQMALQTTLGVPMSQNKIGPAPNRPSARIKILTEGVKLL